MEACSFKSHVHVSYTILVCTDQNSYCFNAILEIQAYENCTNLVSERVTSNAKWFTCVYLLRTVIFHWQSKQKKNTEKNTVGG